MDRQEKTKPKVVIEKSTVSENINNLKEIAEVVTVDPYSSNIELLKAVKDAIAVVSTKLKLSGEILEEAKNLRIIARTGVGVDETRVDLTVAKKREILITYNPGVNSVSVAELTILIALALLRKIFVITRLVKDDKWKVSQQTEGRRLNGMKWGIIGFGNIGQRVTEILKNMNVTVLVDDPYLSEWFIESKGCIPVSLDELLKESDIVSLHLPLIKKESSHNSPMQPTYHIIGEREISLMKKGSILINVARGGIVDEKALLNALNAGKLAGAGLDTLETEPLSADSPLLSLENVIVTPHIGGSTDVDHHSGSFDAVEEVIRFLKGVPPLHPFRL
ncbi:MAG: NAD(P)-dependent oxidoreductase [Thermoplasmatales archaeon]|jgi:D-3-phosphoglycerate dehydrogenase|nr:3-phosphoglycerate dehydrogenase [Candidatus Thermoplasmatota archaeon]MCL6002670.1 3-phosphoglycerate dehydrogenase [Candidatus Thermoplasmatota archaeon]MDA8054814.1 NAD(P)-dependent oxidoreductase [Thermoplasmatales archaeon]